MVDGHAAAGGTEVDTAFAAAASISIEALNGPVEAIIFSRGNRASTARGSGVRSRMTKTTSKGSQTRDEVVGLGDMVGEDGDLSARRNGRPVRHLQRHVLVVVEDRDLHGGAAARRG